MNRRLTLAALCSAALLLAQSALADPALLRIGFQKGSTSLVLAKEHQLLEKRFPNTQVKWIEFPAGPQMLEALNVGSLDVGSTGDIPPIFAQAAGADLQYIGAEPPKPQAEAIIVKPGSPLHDVAQLKGLKVAFQKGSSSHNLLLRALRKAGLSIADIQPVYLSPADARPAFEQGAVDAWVIWDPYYSAMEEDGRARLLANGEGLGLSGPFYLSTRAYAKADPAFITALLDTISQAEALTRSEPDATRQLLAQYMGLSEAVIARTFKHRPASPIGPVTPQVIAAQQETADLFFANRLIPRKLSIAQVAGF